MATTAPLVAVRRLCPHGMDTSHLHCPGPPTIRLSDSDLVAAFYDVLTKQDPCVHPDLAGPKVRQLAAALFGDTR